MGGIIPGAGDTAVIDTDAARSSLESDGSDAVCLDRLVIGGSGAFAIYGGALQLNNLTIDSRDEGLEVWIVVSALFIEAGRLHSAGGGSIWLEGTLDVSAADHEPFDLSGSMHLHLGGPLRVAGDVTNVTWLPPQVELGNGPNCLAYAYEQGGDSTTIHALPRLEAGDADMDSDFDQFDWMKVALAGNKYLTGQPATWGEGDWNGAPGGCPENPPPGNGLFDQVDIIAASPNPNDSCPLYRPSLRRRQIYQASLFHTLAGTMARPRYGTRRTRAECRLKAPPGEEFASLSVTSTGDDLVGEVPESLRGPVDLYHNSFRRFGLYDYCDADPNPTVVFKSGFYGSFASLEFTAKPGLSIDYLRNEWFVAGGFPGGDALGDVNLIYVEDLQPGDANHDFSFDQLDIVQVLQAGKYLSGQPATWGDGDWNGGPGGYPGEPPAGDGLFDQLDIVAALQTGAYLSGAYAAIKPGGVRGDEQTSVVYDPATGEIGWDVAPGRRLTSILISSAARIFTGNRPTCLGSSALEDSDEHVSHFTWGSNFGSMSCGNAAQPGLGERFIRNDLTVNGSLAGGGNLGDVDLIYIPEPSALLLAAMAITGLLALSWRLARRAAPFTLGIVVLAATVPSVHATLLPNGVLNDEQTSIVYYPDSGEMAVDAPASTNPRPLSSINIISAACIFKPGTVVDLGGDFDEPLEHCNIFVAPFGNNLGSKSFGDVTPADVSYEFLLDDLTVMGSLANGDPLGPVDLIYVHELLPGDANRDFSFDQLDIVQVLQARKYLTGQPATWGEGDWNGGPGGYSGEPPAGDGLFDQLDIVAALQTVKYFSGAYAAIQPGGVEGDDRTSVVYDARTGELGVDVAAGNILYVIDIESSAGVFTGTPPSDRWFWAKFSANGINLLSDSGIDENARFLGPVAQPGLGEEFLLNDLTVLGITLGLFKPIGDVDLIYLPEPSALLLATMGITGWLAFSWRLARRPAAITLAIALLAAVAPSARAELLPNGDLNDERTSIVYYPRVRDHRVRGAEIAVDAPAGRKLTSIAIDSVACVFTGDAAQLVFGNGSDLDCLVATWAFGDSFDHWSFGDIAQPGLSQDLVLNNFTAVGSLAGGIDLGLVDLVYMHELSSGDANRDFSFDQLDIVAALQAGNYLQGGYAAHGDDDTLLAKTAEDQRRVAVLDAILAEHDNYQLLTRGADR